MYASSKRSKRKVFHYQGCPYEKRLSPANTVYFHTDTDAVDAGYTSCKCCSRMRKLFKTEKEKINRIVATSKLRIRLLGEELYIETPVASWKLVLERQKQGRPKKLVLYHNNSAVYRRLPTENGLARHNYHLQTDVSKSTISEYLTYITRHDDWRLEILDDYKKMPNRTRKQKNNYNRRKKRAKKEAVHYVCNLIEKLQAEEKFGKERIVV
ncbi:hypothetical protein M2145_001008 [Lachnospiraceae bacterium PF1-21]|uniref:hypothetical protein n=1 Tax=Ohessyouella blattaphilus TaxID=2949333 RepID=UPI003E1C8C1E